MADGLGGKGMRIPPVYQKKEMRKNISLFILGFICGAVLFVQFTAKKIDNLDEQVIILNNEKSELEDEVAKLRKELTPNPSKILKITVDVLNAPDGFAETKIIQLVKEDLAYLIDQPIDKVSGLPQAIYNSLHDREYKINERRFVVKVQYFVIAKETRFWLKLITPKSNAASRFE
jgi:hypothetical protein